MIGGSFKPCFLGIEAIEKLSNILEIDTAKFDQKICDEFALKSQEYNISKEILQFLHQDTASQQKKQLEKLENYATKLAKCLKAINSYTKTKIIDISILSGSHIFTDKQFPDPKDLLELSKYASIVKQNLKTQSGPRKKRASLRDYISYLYDLFEHLTGKKPSHSMLDGYVNSRFLQFVYECLKQIGEDPRQSTLSAQIEVVFKLKVKTSQK